MLFAFSTLGGDRVCLLVRSRTDPNAYADFYEAYAERLLGYLVARVLDVEVALDLMSETFAKALQRRQQFRGKTAEEERAWLFAIATSELTHYWRRGKIERRALSRLGVDVPALSDPELERMEERIGVLSIAAQLQEQMNELPEDQRRAVLMRVVDEQPYESLAADMDTSAQVARARVSRALRALASGLRARGVVLEDVA